MPRYSPWRATVFGLAIALLCTTSALSAPAAAQTVTQQGWDPQQALRAETYIKPPAVIERIVTTPRTDISFTNPSPDRKWFVRTPGIDRGDIDEYGKTHIYLGGLQVDTRANRARSMTISLHQGITLVDPRTNATRTIETPKSVSISAPTWSPNGTQIAYIANGYDASHIYVADVASGKSTQITKTPLLATFVTDIDWTADGKSIVTVLVPENRGAPPTHGKNGIEDGPQVRITDSRALPQVIHASLLEDPHDKALLEYYTTGQLAMIDVKSKAVKKIGQPTMIQAVDASPDAKYFRVTVMTKPFSYIVPVTNFGNVQQLWDADGKVVATLVTTPLREGGRTRDGAVGPAAARAVAEAGSDTVKRDFQWNPSGAGLVFLQSVAAPNAGANRGRAGSGARGGRGGAPAPNVRVVAWVPPFGANDTKVLYDGSSRLTSVAFSDDAKTMFVADSGTVFAIRTADPSKKFSLGRGVTIPSSTRGFGGGRGNAADSLQGGALLMTRAKDGDQRVLVASDGKTVFTTGTKMPGAKWNTEAPRPWVDKVDMETASRSRVFESAADAFDQFVAPLDDDMSQFIYTHESPTVITDAYLRDTKAGTSKKLTSAKDASPEVTNAHHKRFAVTRPRDGLKFWVDLTMPADWHPGTRLPGLIWFYPREYTSQAEYDRSRYTTNINQFPDVAPARPASSVKLWVTQGYALIEPDAPIVGDSGKMNDNYTRDLKEDLDAVIDAAVDSGFVDRDRMAVGGHSYGAFSTVNALTLTPYFKAGIAGDGMYNRSLTPFGFQSERRDFFQAQNVYLDMSPFYRADKIHGALLMYHALEDQNVGTAPISSIRMYHALQGLGKPAALYMYPYEDHSDGTYATDLDLWARWIAWLDMYVKNPANETKSATP